MTEQHSQGAPDYLTGPALILVGLVALTILAPLTVPTALVVGLCWYAIGGRARWLLLAGLVATASMLAISSPGAALSGWQRWADLGDPQHVALLPFVAGFGPAGPALGLTCAGIWAGLLSTRARRDPQHPLSGRLHAQEDVRLRRKARKLAGRLGGHRDALGVLVEPTKLDRRYWRPRWTWTAWGPGRVLAPATRALAVPLAIFGMPHSGKTTLIERLAWLAGRARIPFYLVDAKGTDPTLPPRVLAAFRAGWPDARALVWPSMPLDGWRCEDPNELVGRLMAVVPFTRTGPAAHYAEQAKALLQLAVCAPDGPPSCSDEFLERLDLTWLARAWRLDAIGSRRVAQFTKDAIVEHAAKFEILFHSLAGRLDGPEPVECFDVAVLVVPGLGDREAAHTVARWLLADLQSMAGNPARHRRGDRALVVVDEYSALGSDAVIDLAQRARDAGVTVIPAAQALADVGDDRDVQRLVASCAGGIVALCSEDGERLARLGGHEVDDHHAGRPNLHPDQFGRLHDGEGFFLLGREAARIQVIRNAVPGLVARTVADDLEVLADATDGPLRAQAWRMATVAGELAPPRPTLPTPDRPALPAPARRPVLVRLRLRPQPTEGVNPTVLLAAMRATFPTLARLLGRHRHVRTRTRTHP
jgi:hypothetical protein